MYGAGKKELHEQNEKKFHIRIGKCRILKKTGNRYHDITSANGLFFPPISCSEI